MEKDPQDTENNSKTEQQSKEQTAPKSERRQQDYIKTKKIERWERTPEELEFKRYRYLLFVAYIGRKYHGWQKLDPRVNFFKSKRDKSEFQV